MNGAFLKWGTALERWRYERDLESYEMQVEALDMSDADKRRMLADLKAWLDREYGIPASGETLQ